jgi:hypothetical protein
MSEHRNKQPEAVQGIHCLGATYGHGTERSEGRT